MCDSKSTVCRYVFKDYNNHFKNFMGVSACTVAKFGRYLDDMENTPLYKLSIEQNTQNLQNINTPSKLIHHNGTYSSNLLTYR